MGLFDKTNILIEFKKIRVHLVFTVKHDRRHKSRLVADGHLTNVPLESVYAGVVSILGLRICIIQLWRSVWNSSSVYGLICR